MCEGVSLRGGNPSSGPKLKEFVACQTVANVETC